LFSGCSLYYRRLHPFFLSLNGHTPADYSQIPASDPETAPSEDESCPVNRQRSTSDGEAAAKKSENCGFTSQIWASDLEISRSEPDTGGSEVPLSPSEVPPFELQK